MLHDVISILSVEPLMQTLSVNCLILFLLYRLVILFLLSISWIMPDSRVPATTYPYMFITK